VSNEGFPGLTSKVTFGGLAVFELSPDKDCLIAGSRHHEILGAVGLLAGDDGGDPVAMASQLTSRSELDVHSWVLLHCDKMIFIFSNMDLLIRI
jgi:hypothetical protein